MSSDLPPCTARISVSTSAMRWLWLSMTYGMYMALRLVSPRDGRG